MGSLRAMALVLVAAVGAGCAPRVPQPSGVAPDVPRVSWVFMSGDAENPDSDFVCQSDPVSDCVIDASRPGAQAFSDVHVYYHNAGGETKYEGTLTIGFFESTAPARAMPTSVVVSKNEPIANQSVTGIVTARPGTYAVVFALSAAVRETGRTQAIRQSVQVVVK